MSDGKPRSLWFYLFGCTPWTFVLLGLLFLAVMGPALVNVVMLRSNPPEPRVYPLPDTRQGRPWMLVNGSWRWSEDHDDDGRPECFRRVASGDDFYAVDGYEKVCARGALGALGRVKGLVPLEPELRDALTHIAAYKLERGWLQVTMIDSNDDGLGDCVIDHSSRGVILRRTGTECPGDEYSIPAPLEDHPRRVELEELFARENEVRALTQAATAE